MKFYYLGQISMANRGCEALIRSNTCMIRERHPTAELLCPSENIRLDEKQWPDAAEHGIRFVPMPPFPISLKIYGRFYSALPAIRNLGMLPIGVDAQTRAILADVDGVLMTGGDIISLDYGLNALYFWAGLVDAAHRIGKPTHLLAASVGPFTKDPLTERQMIAHLKRYTSISVRETASLDYLKGRGIENVKLVADPAFVMKPELFETTAFMPEGREYLGFNVSPLVRKFRTDEASRRAFDEGIITFIRRVATETKLSVMLIPHVDPLSGQWDNSDRQYMLALKGHLSDLGNRISMMPELLNAAQIKHVLGKCRYFIGARTHATIGAISQHVPTLSIAYSVKAVGINKDLFGSTKYVLPTPDTSAETLWAGYKLLEMDEGKIKALLVEKLPIWQKSARRSVEHL